MNVRSRSVLYISTFFVAGSPFIWALYPILGFPDNPDFHGSNLIIRAMVLSAFFENKYFPFILETHSYIIWYAAPYLIFILFFHVIGLVVMRVTCGRTAIVQNMSILTWLVMYLVAFYVPFLPAIGWP